MKPFFLLSLILIAPHLTQAAPADAKPRRVEVLFMGAPPENHPAHQPIECYRVLKKAVGVDGINLSYSQDLTDFRREVLDRYDGVMFYGNWKKSEPMYAAQEKALLGYIEDGGGFLPIHCASACFGGSPAFINLVGARFKSHKADVFTTKIVAPEHPIMKDYAGFETWDETYVHDQFSNDRSVLQVREEEPWTWVRNQGKGRIFYTAYGHDMRTWGQPAFHELLRRAILWTVGDAARARLDALKIPKLETEEMILPGYLERKTITRGQKPLSPTESLKMAQVPNGYDISLFASEPNIVNPIYITWDEKGHSYVIETVDYPNNLQSDNLGHDRIHRCVDTDGDGKADQFTLFADKLSIPTAAVFANGGLIVTHCTEMIFLKDTDGDGKADLRKVLFSGFNPRDTHAGVSNLRYGFDNWIYATVGYAGFKGTVGGEEFDFKMGLFRFKADGSKLEFLQNTTNNTWGLGFTSDFDILGSTANGNPSWYYTFSKNDYDRVKLAQPRTPAGDNNPMYFPSSMDIRQVDQHNRYTSAANHSFYTATRFPENYRDRMAFVCEPTGKLVGQFDVTPKGAGFTSDQLPNNLYSSADAWSGPVAAETGPDGAIWVADWYNLIIQHNPTPTVKSAGYDAVTGKGAAYESPIRHDSMGRIFRIFPRGSKNDDFPKLVASDPASLIAGLSHPNLFWRLQAQRLIVESGSATPAPELKKIIQSRPKEQAATHAFYALQGLNALDPETIQLALQSGARGLHRAALSATTRETNLIQNGTITATTPRALAETFVALSRLDASESAGKALLDALQANSAFITDADLYEAWQIAARQHAVGVILASVGINPVPPAVNPVIKSFNSMASPARDALATRLKSRNEPQAQELAALFTAEPVVIKEMVRVNKPNRKVMSGGAAVYNRTCVACHGPEGLGVPGAFPPLDGSPIVVGNPGIPARIVLHGLQGPIEVLGKTYNNIMPAHTDLTDNEISDVLTYIRQSWTNDAPAVPEPLIRKTREQFSDRKLPWTAAELLK
jgi:uncharacterized protein